MLTKIEFGTSAIESASNRAEELLRAGQTVVLTLKFKGREMAHTEIGFEAIRRILLALSPLGRSEAGPRLTGRRLTTTIVPWRYAKDA